MINRIGLSVVVVSTLLVAGCSSSRNIQPLPQGGPTTSQIWHGAEAETANTNANTETSQTLVSERNKINYNAQPITYATGMSTTAQSELAELNADFHRIPNPQILGYVYPHFNQANMPVPGYFTVFKLYDKDPYALMREGAGAAQP